MSRFDHPTKTGLSWMEIRLIRLGFGGTMPGPFTLEVLCFTRRTESFGTMPVDPLTSSVTVDGHVKSTNV